MSANKEKLKNKIIYRASYRGSKEMDILMSNFVNSLIEDLNMSELKELDFGDWEGRRWSDGLHQSIEAKEYVPIQSETQTLASITYQNFFLHIQVRLQFQFFEYLYH